MNHAIQFDLIADLYDSYVTADFDIPFFLEEAKQIEGKVLELTSGTGRVSLALLYEGVDLTCVDYSESMLELLKHKADKAGLVCKVYHMDITTLALPECYDLIIIPFNSILEIVEPPLQRQALARIRQYLAYNGTVIVTMHNPAVRLATIDGKERELGMFSHGNDTTLVVRYRMNYDAASQIASGRQYYDIRDAHGVCLEARELPVQFYLFTREEFVSMARDAGFRIETVFGNYDRTEFDPAVSPYMIWMLKGT